MDYKQSGWYSDPSGDVTRLRYWDGAQWTNHYAPVPQPTLSPQQAQPLQQQVYSQGSSYSDSSSYGVGQTGGGQSSSYGAGQGSSYGGNQAPYATTGAPTNNMDGTKKTLRLIAFILCCISMVSVFWTFFPLIWMIPMSVFAWGLYNGTKRNTVVFSVCVLLFVNFVAGILLLVSGEDRPGY